MTKLLKLLAISGASPFSPEQYRYRDNMLGLGVCGEQLKWLLSQKNGFYAFESALHVFPSHDMDALERGLSSWNDLKTWKYAYGGLIEEQLFCFAEDIFGGQFCIVRESVHRFDPETGVISEMAADLESWADLLLDDYRYEVGYESAHQWQLENGPIEAGKRLIPRKPFVIGGLYDIGNLYAIDAVAGMRVRGEVALQISELPDGTEVEIEYI